MSTKLNQAKPPYTMIAILFIGTFVSFLNNTLLNIALPTLMVEFSVNPSTVQWLTTGFMLVNGILVPASAFLITRFTNRSLFITAMSLFSAGTLLAAIAPEFGYLLAGRMIQAAGSAVMMPLLMNILLTSFPVEKRGRAMGLFGLVMFTAPALGPTLSGWIIEHYSWRHLFYIVLPISLFSLLLAIFKLKNITENKKMHFDYFSIVLSTIGFGGVLFGFSSAGNSGWTDPIVLSTIAVGALAVTVFILRQLKLETPMLEFRIYKYPMFALSSVISSVVSMAMFSGMILTPVYVQTVRGILPMDSGLLMLPGALVMAIMSPITGRLFDKYGARFLALIGLTITSITTYMLVDLHVDTSYNYLMIVYTIRMFGMSMVMMPIQTNGLNQLPMRYNPHGAAMNNMLSQVSGAIGTALLLTFMNNRTETSAKALFADAIARGQEVTAELEAMIGKQALLDGINYSFLIATILTVLALVLSVFVKRVTPPDKQQNVTINVDSNTKPTLPGAEKAKVAGRA